MDNRILSTIIENSRAACGHYHNCHRGGRRPGTLEEVYELFLIQEGFLQRTSRGREATAKAYEHLGKKMTRGTGSLLFPDTK